MEEKKHTSAHYEKELQEIKESLLYLGAMIEKAIERAMGALLDRDSELARRVIDDDDLIDQLDVETEERCIRVLALRQPAARDLRFIATAIKINGHLERIGDMAVNIAERAIILNEEPQLKPYIDLPRMADITRCMIGESLDALVNENVELANKVRKDDETIDKLNEQISTEIINLMMDDPRKIHVSLLIMQIAKNLERIADHAESIANRVIYMITGKNVRHKSPFETMDK
ncbi:MAG: phosphate signaling complex protein PhoU [Syntrophales bacterium]